MYRKVGSFAKQVSYPIIAFTLYGFVLALVLPRQIGLTFRYDFSIVIPFIYLLLGLSFYFSGYKGRLIALSVTLIIFALPLSGLWNSGNSERYLIGGLFPFSDAYHYYMDAKRLLIQQPFSDFTARRPLFSAMLAVILFVTKQNLQVTLALLVLITACSSYIATREIQKEFGTIPAVLFLTIVFLFYRPLIGKTMTENLGLPLGLLGLALMIKSSRLNKPIFSFFGIFFTTVSLNARAGAFFVLPAYIIWGIIVFKEKKLFSLRFLLFSLLSIFLGFGLNLLIFKFLTDGGMLFSNFSTTIYGLAVGGKSWTRIFNDYPKLTQLPEPQFSYKVYQYAFEEIIRDPKTFLYGLTTTWKMFFGTGPYSVFCFVGGENQTISLMMKLGLYATGLIGLLISIVNIKIKQYSLILCSFIGLFISIPFVPPIDASNMRAYAATLPLIALIPSIGIKYLFGKIKLDILHHIPAPDNSRGFGEITFGSALVIIIISSLFIKPFQAKPIFSKITCPAGESVLYIRNFNGSFLHLVSNSSISQDFLPDIRINYFLNKVHDLPQFETFYDFDNLKENTTIVYDLDLVSSVPYMIFFQNNMIPSSDQIMGVCGKLTDNPTKIFRFFYASSIQAVAEQ